VVNSTTQMKVLNTETLQTEVVYEYSVDPQPYYEEIGYTFFTDGELLGYIMPAVEVLRLDYVFIWRISYLIT